MKNDNCENTKRRKAWPFVCLCFVLSALIVVLAVAAAGIYPFGDTAFVTWDEKYQYFDFFAWLKRVMAGEASLFYTSATGLGSNAWGLFSYYLSSPFNLLLVFFDAEHIEDFIFVATTLKLACAGASMAFFLRRRFECSHVLVIVLALGYACSSWAMSQSSNIMWLDALYILPFALWGSHELVRAGKWRMLTFSVAASLFTCWYMGYVVALFAVLYTVWELYLSHVSSSPITLRSFARIAARYAGCMVLAVVLSAFTFVPTILNMLYTDDGLKSHSMLEGISSGLSKFGLPSSDGFIIALLLVLLVIAALVVAFSLNKRFNIKVRAAVFVIFAFVLTIVSIVMARRELGDLALAFLPYGYDVWASPQFYSGSVALVMIVPYFLDREISLKERVATGVFLWFLILTCLNSLTYCVWCGMRVPGGYYCRVAFLPVVIMLCMAARTGVHGASGLSKRAEKQVSRPWWHYALGVLLVIALAAVAYARAVMSLQNAAAAVVTAVAAVLLVVANERVNGRSALRACSVLLVLLSSFELAATGALILQSLHSADFTNKNQSDYYKTMSSEVDAVTSLDTSCYRMEKTFTHADSTALSESMSLGYDALSSYSSAHCGRALALLQALGYGDQDMFTVEYTAPNMLADSIFGVKYIWSTDDLCGMNLQSMASTSSSQLRLYGNATALPLAFAVDGGVKDAALLEERNPFKQQNAFVSSLMGQKIQIYKLTNASQSTDPDGTITYTVVQPAGMALYFYVQGETSDDYSGCVNVSVDGGGYQSDAYAYRHGTNLLAAASDSQQTHQVKLSVSGAMKSDAACLFYVADPNEVQNVLGQLALGGADVQQFSDGYFSMSYSAREDGLLMVTIPNEDGWSVTVNGKRVGTEGAYDGALMLVPVSAGENNIEATFTPPGLYAGAAVSAVGLVVVVVLLLRSRSKTY